MLTPAKTYGRARRLRRKLSPPELRLWLRLRERPSGLKFRNQHPLGVYILDFYCAEATLCIEVDGYTHENADAEAHDARRDAWLLEQGIETLRLGSVDVFRDSDGAAEAVVQAALRRLGRL